MGPKKKKEEEPEGEPEPMEGVGAFIFDDGSRYEGHWVKEGVPGGPLNVKRHGFGVNTANGNKYEGKWKDDQMCGEGTMYFENGAIYAGHWLNNIFQGKGKYTWPNGCCYDGFWRDNKMHGDGTYRDVTGREWRGRFYNGRGPGLSQQPG
mmetsp:Transcript_40329/g.72075  ORF Transcript_40329/g.72075 Transcript_40329/m.72075 type:complete len:150 (-) Transcript_40329:1253-1702(-)